MAEEQSYTIPWDTIPVTRACAQIDRFSSSDQTRFF